MRHGRAGSKERWHGDDRLRPLTRRGRLEAEALAERLGPLEVSRIVTSPFVRCVQTVEPLASVLQLSVEASGALEPDAGDAAVSLVRELASSTAPGRVVLCTHRETIESLQRALSDDRGGFSPDGAHEKGSVWMLRCEAGDVVSAAYLPPGGGDEEAAIGARSR